MRKDDHNHPLPLEDNSSSWSRWGLQQEDFTACYPGKPGAQQHPGQAGRERAGYWHAGQVPKKLYSGRVHGPRRAAGDRLGYWQVPICGSGNAEDYHQQVPPVTPEGCGRRPLRVSLLGIWKGECPLPHPLCPLHDGVEVRVVYDIRHASGPVLAPDHVFRA